MSTLPEIPAEWFRSGYEASLRALRGSIESSDEVSAFHAMFAALNWAASIRDYLKKRNDPAWKDDTVAAVQFLRNAVHHDWAFAIQLFASSSPAPQIITARGRGGRVITPPVLPTLQWIWPDVADLPSPRQEHGKTQYIRDLQRRPVTEALERLSALYSRVL